MKILLMKSETTLCFAIIVYSGILNFFFIAPPLKIRFSVPVERVETTIFNPRDENRCFNPLHSYSQSDCQKSCYEK